MQELNDLPPMSKTRKKKSDNTHNHRGLALAGNDWLLGEGSEPTKWIPAVVPGNVQEDLWKAGLKPDPYFGRNADCYADTESKFWTYKLIFDMPSDYDSEKSWLLVFDGVDYKADFFLNGKLIGRHEGMFGEICLAVTGLLRPRDNELRVTIHPLELAPRKSRAKADPLCLQSHDGRWMVKALMSFFWDFAPRLVPVGIWKDVRLIGSAGVRLHSPATDCALSENNARADIKFSVVADAACPMTARLRAELVDQDGKPVMTVERDFDLCQGDNNLSLSASLISPNLWWPNGSGEQYLYTARLALISSGQIINQISFNVGIRTFQMIRTPKDEHETINIPASALKSETISVVNGKPIYNRGTNYVPMDILFGRINDERIEKQMRLLREANINMIRVWGGGILNRDRFYDLADKYGIMVWQEFPLGCTDHEGNDHYREILEQEASAIVRRLRHHPSVVIWCGGNELFQPHSGMAPQDRLLRMLNALCYTLDPERPFIASSPYPGAYHGPYTFDCYSQGSFGGPQDHVNFCNNAPDGAYNECGIAGPNHASAIRSMLTEAELWPPLPGTAWEYHKAFGVWGGGETWLCKALIEEYFGRIENIEDLCRAGQFLQAIGLQYLCEELRRRWPNVSGTMPWCFNNPWTTAAGSCVVAYPDTPLPAYYTLKQAYAPIAVSARLRSFVLAPEDKLEIGIFCLNDSGATVGSGTVNLTAGPLEGGKAWLTERLNTPVIAQGTRFSPGAPTILIPKDFNGIIKIDIQWNQLQKSVRNPPRPSATPPVEWTLRSSGTRAYAPLLGGVREAGGGAEDGRRRLLQVAQWEGISFRSQNRYWVGVPAGKPPGQHNPLQCFRQLLSLWRNNPHFRLEGME